MAPVPTVTVRVPPRVTYPRPTAGASALEQHARALEATRAELAGSQQELAAARQELAKATGTLDDRTRALQQRAEELSARTEELRARERELMQRQGELATQSEQLRAEREAALATQSERAEREREAREQAERERAQIEADERALMALLGGTVMFRHDEAILLPAARGRLDRVADALKQMPSDRRIVIEGHADATGTEEYNRRLSEQRASAVRSYLLQRGVTAEQVVAEGRGEQEPIAPNQTAEGRANNRRVEIVIRPSEADEAG